jgi:hypothetical protein
LLTDDPAPSLEALKASLTDLGAHAADAAAAKMPLPWPMDIGWTIRQNLINEVDRIVADEHSHEPIEMFRTIAGEAFDARCNEIYRAWFAAPIGSADQ